MMKYRTDLALECKELYDEEQKKVSNTMEAGSVNTFKKEGGKESGEITGVDMDSREYDKDIKVTRIKILDERGEAALSKKRGTYITLEIEGISEEREGIKERAAKAFSEEIKKLVPFHDHLKVLVVGLGNNQVTPDALGPYTLSKVKITRHLFIIYDCDGDPEMANVSGFVPGVTGSTGIETAELIKKTADVVNPETIVIVDSLAARNIKRVNTTIQINDTGINPGSGMGNNRTELSEETLGRRVVAVGVPTVIDAGTLVIDALSGFNKSEAEISAYLKANPQELVVTSTDIDRIIKDFSDIIASGINISLHPGIYS